MATNDPASLKIGLVLDDSLDPPDGVQQYVRTLGAWLTRQNHDVHYIVGETKLANMPNIHSLSRTMNVRFNGNHMGTPLPATKKAVHAVLEDGRPFDVLHVQSPFSPFMAGRLVGQASAATAVVGTFHVLPDSKVSAEANKFLGLITRRAWRRFDEVACVSIDAEAFAQNICRVKTCVIPNVVDISRFASVTSSSSRSGLTILFLGRLVPRKGCKHLLEALAILVQTYADLPAFQVKIAGKGPLLSELQEFVIAHGLDSIVSFIGFIDEKDKSALLASSDITVLPSTGGESFGISVVEAMASGAAAVLGGDNPGYRSILGNQPALLIKPADHAEFANRLADLLTHASLRLELATWGAEAAKQYDVEIVGRQIVEMYRRSLQSRLNMR